jgi:hypothetical protein
MPKLQEPPGATLPGERRSSSKRENGSAKGPGPMAHGRFPHNGILESVSYFIFSVEFLGLRVVPDAATAASGGSLLFHQYRPFTTLKPKNRKPESWFSAVYFRVFGIHR